MADMNRNRAIAATAALGLCAAMLAAGEQTPVLWANDFEAVEVGSEPEDSITLRGQFTVAQEQDNRVLELPGSPLDTMGLVLGPSHREDVQITARVLADRKGRQMPSFGLGLCGQRGPRLMVAPMRDALELSMGEEPVAAAVYQWKPGRWSMLRLMVVRVDGGWVVRGKAWPQDSPEPEGWLVEAKLDEPPPSGGATLWGLPYSGKPIRFDDVRYTTLN